MKIIATSDPHYHAYKQHSTTIGGVNSRLLDVDKAMEFIQEAAANCGADVITVSGDIFHERGRIKPSVFNVAHNRFASITDKAKVIMSVGNHDMEDFKGGDTSIDTFGSIGNCCVLNGHLSYTKITHSTGKCKIAAVQYNHDIEGFKKAFEEVKDADVIMIHQGIDDFDKTGLLKTELTVKYIESVTDAWVLCGHYHSPNRSGKVIQVGAPLQHNFNDEGDARGYWLIDTDKDEAFFHPIDVTPKFVTLKSKGDAKKGLGGNFVRVISNNQRTAATLEKIAKTEGALSVVTFIEKEFTTSHTSTIKASASPKQMISDFCKLVSKYTPHESEILSLWEKICV